MSIFHNTNNKINADDLKNIQLISKNKKICFLYFRNIISSMFHILNCHSCHDEIIYLLMRGNIDLYFTKWTVHTYPSEGYKNIKKKEKSGVAKIQL